MTSPESPKAESHHHRGKEPLDFSYLFHRQLIGELGFLLPFIVVGMSKLLPVERSSGSSMLESISAYYYTSATAFFVGILFALAMLLFAYRGYEGDKADRVAGKIAGISALCVAFFPTKAPNGFSEPLWWIPWMRTAHYISAVALFLCFIVFSLWLFRKSSVPQDRLPTDKKWRNRIYLWCGIVMIASVLWAASALLTDQDIFWPEAIALWAFAVSWLVKGQAYRKPYKAYGAAVTAVKKLGTKNILIFCLLSNTQF